MNAATPFRVVIPARYASTRLPGKPLRSIHGKPMIEWVYQAAQASGAVQTVVATDDPRIADAITAIGGDSCLTDSKHETGTDRIVEVCHSMAWDDDEIIVNLQGDEPLMPAVNIAQVSANLAASGCDMATLHKTIDAEAAADPNLVKLVHEQQGRALYFSRARIPFQRDEDAVDYCGHIGIYAYRVGFLKTYAQLQPCMLERAEKLEQLRALFHGFSIHTEAARAAPGPGVDTESDLEQVTRILQQRA